jgi:hypothetical protein
LRLAYFLVLAVQAALIVHVIKTGRNMLWIWLIALLPPLGPIVYVAVELLPALFAGRGAQRASRLVSQVMDPDRELRRASTEVQVSGNVDARRRLGDELLERRQFAQAIDTYRSGLKGVFEHDPTLLFGLARAQFGAGDHAAARRALDDLEKHNPEFKSPDARLLQARTLEALGALEEAEREYAAVAPVFPGAEARVRYALLLKRRGKSDAARRELAELLDAAKLGPAHYRRAQSEWLERARREL